ncbi:MAG: YqgE/AlgH family protein [Muribaculaceae bacterium]|nr:YqgE/AlgH family protein [Muribaculaceae bacterium]
MTDIRSTLFNIKLNTGAPKEGSLLIAEPFLKEDCFNHAVILLIDHGKGENSMGLVINKGSQYNFSEIFPAMGIDIPIYAGGPVGNDRLFYLHTLGDIIKESVEIAPGLWVGGDFDDVLEYLRAGYPTDGVIRFFLGYSGWQPGQLEEEISNDVWVVDNDYDSAELLSDNEDSTWHRIVRGMGDRFRGWRYHPMNVSSN